MTTLVKPDRPLHLIPILLALSLCLNGLITPAAHASAPALQTAADFATFFDSTLPAQLAAEHVAGAMVAVVHKGEVVFTQGYGDADVDAGLPVSPERTLFFIGSDGKLFTWTAVMQLVEQGKLDLHADVNAYLDFTIPAAFGKPITLHHLLTHTAGFEDEYNSLLAASQEQVLPLREHLMRYMPARVYPPGAVMAYSNYGTALAGYIVERVSGQPFEAYLTEHLLQPLGMAHSFVGNAPPADQAADLSKGYKSRNGAYIASDFEWITAVPAAPVRTTATDISRFLLAHLNGGCVEDACILRPETVAEMHAEQFTHHPQMRGMAYGFMQMTLNGQEILWHLGGSAHFVTMLALIPDQELGIVVAYNTPPADDGRALLFRFMDEFFPVARAPLPATPLPGATERAAVFNGLYAPARSNHTTSQVLVRYAQTAPVAIAAGQLAFNGWKFVETAPGIFHQVDGDRVLTFQEDAAGKRWLFVGVLAYFQTPWYESLTVLFAGIAGYLLLMLSLLIGWIFLRRAGAAPGWRSLLLAGGLGLFSIGLFAGMMFLLLQYGDTLVYPQAAVDRIEWFYLLTIPWTLAVIGVAANAWLRRRWTRGWRILYTLVAGAAVMFLWCLWQLNLLPG